MHAFNCNPEKTAYNKFLKEQFIWNALTMKLKLFPFVTDYLFYINIHTKVSFF